MNRAIRIGEEDDYGVAVTPDVYFKLAGESLKRKSAFGTIRPERRYAAMRQVEASHSNQGAIDVYAGFESIGWLLKWLVSSASTVLNSGYRVHTFRPSASYAPPSLTMDVGRDVELHRYTGQVFQSGRFSATNQDRHFGMSLACIGKDEAGASTIPDTTESQYDPPAFYDIDAATPFSVTLSDGVSIWASHCESIDLNWTWDRRLRQPERRTTPTGVFGGGVIAATGKVGTLYNDDSDFLLQAIRNRTAISMTLTMQGEIITGLTRQQLVVTIPNCQLNGDPPTLRSSGFGNIDFAVDMGALYSASRGYAFQMEVTNTTLSYA